MAQISNGHHPRPHRRRDGGGCELDAMTRWRQHSGGLHPKYSGGLHPKYNEWPAMLLVVLASSCHPRAERPVDGLRTGHTTAKL